MAAQIGPAHPPDYSPFPPGKVPETVAVEPWVTREPADFLAPGAVWIFSPAAPAGDTRILARLKGTGQGRGWLSIGDRTRTWRVAVPDPLGIPRVRLDRVDLNGDGRPDWVLHLEHWGNGLSSLAETVTLVVSGRTGYQAYASQHYGFESENLVRFQPGGPVHLVTGDWVELSGLKDMDGFPSRYWVHRLFEVRGDRLVRVPRGRHGFPRWMHWDAIAPAVDGHRPSALRRRWKERQLDPPQEIRPDDAGNPRRPKKP